MAKTYPKKSSFACGGKVGHADGGKVGFGDRLVKGVEKAATSVRKAAESVVERATRPKPPEPDKPAPKREAVPAGEAPFGGAVGLTADRLRGIVNRNQRALEEVKEGDRRE